MTTPDHLIEAVALRRDFHTTEAVAEIICSARRGQDTRRATRALSPLFMAHPNLDAEEYARELMTLSARVTRRE